MNTTVNISFQDDLLEQIDNVAKKESRSRSELLREAARLYVDRKERWQKIFTFADSHVRKRKISKSDIEKELKLHRKSRDNL